jgi:RNA polymerase sigma-70 factor (sigma-E family)
MPLSFDDFVAGRLPAVLRFAGVLTGDRYLAEDVVQDVLLKAHKRWSTIAAKEQPEAYIRRMIVNEHISWLRKWARIIPSARLGAIEDQHAVPDHANGHADRADLADRLSKLPARQRAVIVLRYYEGLSDPEIADVLGCGAGTVRGYASRALAALRVDTTAPDLMRSVVATGRESR